MVIITPLRQFRNNILDEAADMVWHLGEHTIAEAIRDMKDTYDPGAERVCPSGRPDATLDVSALAAEIDLIETCGACPEQYDAYIGELQVGYLRLRHGAFTVACPDCGNKIIYESSPEGDGCFLDNERDHFLGEARRAIANWLLFTDEGKAHVTSTQAVSQGTNI